MPASSFKMKASHVEVDPQLQRVEVLRQQLIAEQARAQEFLARLKGEEYQASRTTLPRKAQQAWEKDMSLKLKEYRQQAKRLEKASRGGGKAPPSMDAGIPELKAEEREIKDLEARVSGLEGRVRGFEGLPPDKELALVEVEKMRKELEALARRRDAMFEGLIEGEK
ncbi:MAG: hypothetical protein Q9220_002073 [cf. Caloplaca sp. 1 TL-2023]